VRTSFGAVTLEGVGGAIDVDNQNGAVDIRRLVGKACQKISVKTSFAPIRIALPDNASYTMTARTSFGKIHSDFSITTAGALSGESLSGKIGDGRCEMTLSDSNGNIEIVKK
jgi:DUF4097 and DUF4098 domain-containing protein YvlB